MKGDGDNQEYYQILEVSKRANAEEIKSAYKKKSLQMHPDKLAQRGVQVSAHHSQEFQKMKDAYDVLSDPRKRKLYDELGLSGMKLIESPSEVDPKLLLRNFQKNRTERMKIIILIVFIMSSILLGPILFCLKCDGIIPSRWLAIWSPMWAFDFILIAASSLPFLASDDDHDDDEGNREEGKIPTRVKIHNFVQTCLFVLMQIFILMSLDNRVHWKIYIVFIPWFLWEGNGILGKLHDSLKTIPSPSIKLNAPNSASDEEEDVENKMQYLNEHTKFFENQMLQFQSRKSVLISLFRIWFAIFLGYQIKSQPDIWNWGFVFLPVWVYFFFQFAISVYLIRWSKSILADINVPEVLEAMQGGSYVSPDILLRIQRAQEVSASGYSGIFSQVPGIYIAILVVLRLQFLRVSTFVILLPVYLVLFCCVCGVSCGMCCLSNIDAGEDDAAGLHADRDGGGRDVDPESQMGTNFSDDKYKEQDGLVGSVSAYLPPTVVIPLAEDSKTSPYYGSTDFISPGLDNNRGEVPVLPPAPAIVDPTSIDLDID